MIEVLKQLDERPADDAAAEALRPRGRRRATSIAGTTEPTVDVAQLQQLADRARPIFQEHRDEIGLSKLFGIIVDRSEAAARARARSGSGDGSAIAIAEQAAAVVEPTDALARSAGRLNGDRRRAARGRPFR